MKTERKLLIDAWLGTPLSWILNITARTIGFCLRIDHSLNKPFNTIVISKYKGMGSIIQATPLLQTLKAKFPQAKIIFVTTGSNRILLQHIASVDEILTVDDGTVFTLFNSIFRLVFSLWKRKPDVFIDLEIYSNFSSFITTFSLATNRLGFFKSDKKYKTGLFTHMMYFNQNALLSEVYLQFARLLGCKKIITSLDKIELSMAEELDSEKVLAAQHITPQRYIVINPNASDLRLERRWPAEKYELLIRNMREQFPAYAVVLIGSTDESAYVHTIATAFTDEMVIDTSGKLSLVNLIYLIRHAALLVTNDTGPMHLGFSQGTKTIALFGPCSPVQFASTPQSHFIYKNVYCSPCVHEFLSPPCKGNNQCMKLISVEQVWEAVKFFQTGLPNNTLSRGILYESEYPLGRVLRS